MRSNDVHDYAPPSYGCVHCGRRDGKASNRILQPPRRQATQPKTTPPKQQHLPPALTNQELLIQLALWFGGIPKPRGGRRPCWDSPMLSSRASPVPSKPHYTETADAMAPNAKRALEERRGRMKQQYKSGREGGVGLVGVLRKW